MAEICDPMSVFTNRHVKLLGNVINHRCKKVNILNKDVRILHSNNASALEFTILQVEMQLSATLGLPLIRPINSLTAFRIKGNGDNGPLREGLRLETINHISNLV